MQKNSLPLNDKLKKYFIEKYCIFFMIHLPSVDYKERTNRVQISCDIVQLVIPYIM